MSFSEGQGLGSLSVTRYILLWPPTATITPKTNHPECSVLKTIRLHSLHRLCTRHWARRAEVAWPGAMAAKVASSSNGQNLVSPSSFTHRSVTWEGIRQRVCWAVTEDFVGSLFQRLGFLLSTVIRVLCVDHQALIAVCQGE